MDVQKFKLRDILIIGNGKDHSSLEDGDIPVYGSGGLMRYANGFLFDGESVLLPRKGTLSNIQYVTGKFWTVDTCYYTKINRTIVEPYYLYILLRSLDLSGFDSGASIPSMTSKTYYALNVNIPSLRQQKRIVDVVKPYDNLIEVNNKRIKMLEQMAENLYKEWFVRFRFPGHETAEFENSIPKRWRIKRLGDYGRIETGKTPSMEVSEYYGENYLFIKTPEMHGNMFVIETEEKLSEKGHQSQPKKLLPPYSIMVTCIGTGGIVAINAEKGHTNQQINSIILDDLMYLEWLFFTCKSLRTTVEMFGATGSTMTNLSKGKFEKLKIIEPSVVLIKQYHDLVSSSLCEIEKLMRTNQCLIRQRDLLLPRLMSGKLEV